MILKVEFIEYVGGLNEGFVRENFVKGYYVKVFGLSN